VAGEHQGSTFNRFCVGFGVTYGLGGGGGGGGEQDVGGAMVTLEELQREDAVLQVFLGL
jgi:hypothetical protein